MPALAAAFRSMRPATALLAAGAMVGCAAVDVLNAVEPRGGVTVARDQAYAEGPRHRLDVYRPADADGAAPLVVFFYGGNWDSGEKADYEFVGLALAKRGFVTVIPDYRIYPQVLWPDFLRDSAQAAAWAHQNAARYGADPGKMVLMGHSAGAYNAAMLSIDPRWLGAQGLDPRSDVRAFVGLSGPYDFLPLRSEELKIIFGPEEGRPATQPINHVSAGVPPMFLGAAEDDEVVDPGNGDRLAARVGKAGGRAEVRFYDHVDHAKMIGVFALPIRFLAPVLSDVTTFIRAETGRAQ